MDAGTTIPVVTAGVTVLSFTSITEASGRTAALSSISGVITVAFNTERAGRVDVLISTSCATNGVTAQDVVVASKESSTIGGNTVTFDTTTRDAGGGRRFANGNYCLKGRLVTGSTTLVADNLVPITLANS